MTKIFKKLSLSLLAAAALSSSAFADAETEAGKLACQTKDVTGYYMQMADTEPKWAYAQGSFVFALETGKVYGDEGFYNLSSNFETAPTVSADGKSVAFPVSTSEDENVAKLSGSNQDVAGYYMQISDTEPKWAYAQGSFVFILETAKVYGDEGFYNVGSMLSATVAADGKSVTFGGLNAASCETTTPADNNPAGEFTGDTVDTPPMPSF